MEYPKTNENSGKRLPVLVLALLLILSLGGNLMLWNKKNTIETELRSRVDTLGTSNANLEVEVKSKIGELEVFRGKNDSLNKVIDEGVTKVATLEKEISQLKKEVKSDAGKRKELQAKIAKLNQLTEEYLERIDHLMTENQLLKKDNEELTSNLVKSNACKTELQQKVNMAAALRTEYVKVTPMKKRFMSEKLEETSMARKVIRIDACMTVLENKLAPTGKKIVYVRVIAPDGKVAGSPTASSGKFPVSTGDDQQYTVKKEIDYTGNKADVCLDYEEPEKGTFGPGNYTVEIYIDGQLTSTVGIKLK